MRLADLMSTLEAVAPLDTAEDWDNVGLLAGDPAQDVTRALLTVDFTPAVAAEAIQHGCHAVLAYHPPIFRGLKRVVAGSPVFDAVRNGMAIYSFHTALDVAPGGTNDVLADALGLSDRCPLRPLASDPTRGMGRVGTVPSSSLSALVNGLKAAFNLPHVLVAGNLDQPVATVALCVGSGASFLPDAYAAKADVYVTGELKHHDALEALAHGCAVVATLHSNGERPALAHLLERLKPQCPGVTFLLSAQDRDPFSFA